MKKYKITLQGASDMLMHRDNISGTEMVRTWQKDPRNKGVSTPGDDRTPAWTWLTYLNHANGRVGIDSDNLMSMFRDAGKKMPASKGKGSLKAMTQSGIVVNEIQWDLIIKGKTVSYDDLKPLYQEGDFAVHESAAADRGFELFVKRATVGASKHIRVRPRFSNWAATGTVTILNPIITRDVLETLLMFGGSLCGIGDWRPSAPKSPGPFGKFNANVQEVA